MKIIYRDGDLLKQKDISVVSHQANCLNSMSKGIALSIKKQFPEANDVDQATAKGYRGKLGTFSITKNTTPIIANIYSQYNFYPRNIRHTDYGAMGLALDALGKYMTEKGLTSLGVPFNMGCGLGGGDWRVVEDILTKFTEKYENIQVYVVKL